MEQKLIILRGAPSSGKSTIAKRMRNFEAKTVWLKVDNFKDFFSDDATPFLEYVHGLAIASLEYLLNKGFSVVMEGVFQEPDYIKQAVDMANAKNILCKVFQLAVPLEQLKERDKSREGVKEGLRPALAEVVIERLFNIQNQKQYPDSINLDTHKNNIDQCIEIIKASFS